jgi:uncharacterized phiE125 gp8 family phage protein
MIDATKYVEQKPVARLLGAQNIVADPVEPVTLQRAKEHCNVTLPDWDAYISTLITVAREMAEGKLNRTIMRRQLTQVFDDFSGPLRLAKPPLVSIDSITYIATDGTSQAVDTSIYYVSTKPEPARINLMPGFSWPALHDQTGAVVVTYTAGYAPEEVPAAIIHWMLLQIGTMYENRETVSAGVQLYDMSERVTDLLIQPYRVYE